MANEFIARNGIISKSNLVVSGSLTALSTITAQTLVVQTITSSISSITGSTNFGSLLANTHTFTGSLNVTGGLAVTTNGIEFQVNSAGVNLGNALTDSHVISGSLRVNPNGLFVSSSGNVGIGTSSPGALLDVNGIAYFRNASGIYTDLITAYSGGNVGIIYGASGNLTISGGSGATERMRVTSTGNVGIGETPTSSIGWARILTLNGNNVGDTAYILKRVGSAQEIAFGTDGASLYIDVAGASTASNNTIRFRTSNTNSSYSITERMRITSDGNVGIGTTDPSGTRLRVEGGELRVTTTNLGVALYRSANTGEIAAYNWDGAAWVPLGYAAQSHIWKNSGTEGMRLTTVTPNNMACLSVGDSSPGGSYAINAKSLNGAFAAKASGAGDANYYSTSNTIGYHIYADRGAGAVFYVATNGDVRNANNSYGSTSDIKLKENITDASPKLEDLLKVKVRNYNFISDENKTKQIGVIAQELEEIFPNMISEDKQMGTDETIKTVKYSVFVPMLVKAIQELEARVKELENK